jgi:hypothetical protein
MTSHLQASVASLDQFMVIPRHHGEACRTVTTEVEHPYASVLGHGTTSAETKRLPLQVKLMAFLKKTSLQHSGNHRRTVFSTIDFISQWVIGLPLIEVVLSRGSRDDAGRSHCRPFPEAVVFTEEDVPNTAGITDGQSSAPQLSSHGRAMTFTEEDVPSTQRESPTDTFSIKARFPLGRDLTWV